MEISGVERRRPRSGQNGAESLAGRHRNGLRGFAASRLRGFAASRLRGFAASRLIMFMQKSRTFVKREPSVRSVPAQPVSPRRSGSCPAGKNAQPVVREIAHALPENFDMIPSSSVPCEMKLSSQDL